MANNVAAEPAHPREQVITSEADLRAALAVKLLENWDAGDPAANDELIRRLGEWHRSRRHRDQSLGRIPADDVLAPVVGSCVSARPHLGEVISA